LEEEKSGRSQMSSC